ncbi:MAG: cysteine--tRNA ligase [Acidimicrobiales bacterium]
MLHLHDTATGTVRPLDQRDASEVSMYVCGPTVYDVPHLGHGRFALVFDVLRRYLEFTGVRVRYVSNITDIDDRIIERARAESRTEADVAAEFEVSWWEAMDALGVMRPTESPHATAWVAEMVSLVSELIDRESAYVSDDGVYLSVDRIQDYGLLAHQSLASLKAGARVEVDEHKRSPADFALWKNAKPGEPSWDAPFGRGRPGWHTECVVMSLGLLGDGFDLHGGGLDLAFPHHENERAQAVALGRAFARHWAHNGFVEVEGQKMSKSLGNFTSLIDLLERSDSRAYRLLVLRSHYRSPIEVTRSTVADAEAALARLDNLARRFRLGPELVDEKAIAAESAIDAGADAEALVSFALRMEDDLDTPGAVALVFDLATRANASADRGETDHGHRLALTAALICAALGLVLRAGIDEEPDEEIRALAQRRDAARAAGDFALADVLRDEIKERGWILKDSPDGTRLHRA